MTLAHALFASVLFVAITIGATMADDKPAATNTMGAVNNNSGIITQGQIGNNTIYNKPPRRGDRLYQDDEMIGRVQAAKIGPEENQITFTNLRISSNTIDLSKPLEFQNLVFRCSMLPKQSNAINFSFMVVGEVVCDIVGRR